MLRFIILLPVVFALPACAHNFSSDKINAAGYIATTDYYTPEKSVPRKNITIITLHGKRHGRQHECNTLLGSALSNTGYTVYAPEMPWGDAYTATRTTAFHFLDALIEKASANGNEVVIMGHSIGATMALLYATTHKPPTALRGIIMLAPGHMLHVSVLIQDATALSVQKARKLIKHDLGDKHYNFVEFNQGKQSEINTTAEIYLSYFDPKDLPNPLYEFEKLKIPLLWVDGRDDTSANNIGYEYIYQQYVKHDGNNQYRIVRGGHVSMCYASSEPILAWLRKLPSN